MAKKTKSSGAGKTKSKSRQPAGKSAPKKRASKRAAAGPKARGPFTPSNDRILVRPLTEAESGTRSPSGIIIPDTVSKEKPEQGIVVATGPGRWDEDGVRRIPVSVSAGDRIVFSKYGYDEVKIGGQEYYIVSDASILGIINE